MMIRVSRGHGGVKRIDTVPVTALAVNLNFKLKADSESRSDRDSAREPGPQAAARLATTVYTVTLAAASDCSLGSYL